MNNTIITTISGVNFYYMGKCAEFKNCHILSYDTSSKNCNFRVSDNREKWVDVCKKVYNSLVL